MLEKDALEPIPLPDADCKWAYIHQETGDSFHASVTSKVPTEDGAGAQSSAPGENDDDDNEAVENEDEEEEFEMNGSDGKKVPMEDSNGVQSVANDDDEVEEEEETEAETKAAPSNVCFIFLWVTCFSMYEISILNHVFLV